MSEVEAMAEQLDEPEAGPEERAGDDIAAQIEEATAEVCRAQFELQEAEADAGRKALEKKAAVQEVECKRDWLSDASRRLRKLREGRFPDGDKYPMFDHQPAEPDA